MGEPTLRSISDISTLSLSSRDGDGFQIPKEFIVPEFICPSLPFDSLPTVKLPVIDFKGLVSLDDAHNTASRLTKMCEEWGFFQVVNHGVASEALERMAQIGNDFFSLPIHEKEKGNLPFMGYVGKHVSISGIGTSWVETLSLTILPENNVETFETKMWPHGNPHFCKCIYEFAKELESLESTILQLLAMGLGLESSDFFSKPFTSGDWKTKRSFVSFNYYPPCTDPSKVLGLFPHTDPTCLTALFQDKVSGLQIMAKDGTWHNVQHQPSGIIFFVGDILQGWSNNRFPASIHRVVLNQKIPRLSFLHSTNPPADLVLEPPSKIIDDDHPLLYKPFTNAGFMKFRRFSHVLSPHEPNPIDIYAGLDNTHSMAMEKSS